MHRHLFNRYNPSAFKIKFSLWKKSSAQNTTDIVPVHDIHIHPRYPSIHPSIQQEKHLIIKSHCVLKPLQIQCQQLREWHRSDRTEEASLWGKMSGGEPGHQSRLSPLVPWTVPAQSHLQHLRMGTNRRSVPGAEPQNSTLPCCQIIAFQ